jgi:YebC/PmpR family DNA-binding regulatory protein
MGRAFEFRRARKEKRWDKMAKAFTKLGREIAISVKLGGPNPETNARLRVAMQNAKGVNMPKDRVEGAIKRASSKDEKDFEEMVYEGYAPHGVAVVVETATDNTTRTVANVRLFFNKAGGSLGTTGSLNFMFDRKGVFKMPSAGLNLEDLELELIDFGAEDIFEEDGEITIYTPFTEFGAMLKAIEERKLPVTSSELVRVPNTFAAPLTEAQEEDVLNMIDKLEEDDDVQAVYHNMRDGAI